MMIMWNHNTHFHSYLLHQFPGRIHRALDIGCGLGTFAKKLDERAEIVDALDVDQASIYEALNCNAAPSIRYIQADFLQTDLPSNSYDVVVSIASLHHMNLEATLEKMKLLLRSLGTLVILGLYRETTIIDYFYSLVSVPLNFACLNWHQSLISTPAPKTIPPTRPADLSLNQIREVANTLLPGCCLRRHLFWRYSLIWRKP
jgi:SAM-dependent methyltransferase